MAKDPDACSICGEYMAVLCLGHRTAPFIDGRKYEMMCDCCLNVPKMYEYDEKKEELIVFEEMDHKRLHTAKEMVEDGFEERLAKKSIKAVKAKIKKRKKG